MISMIPLDRFSEYLETRNQTWSSPDGLRSTTDVYHIKTHRLFTQIEIISRIENEYFDAMSHLEKYLVSEKKQATQSQSSQSPSSSSCVSSPSSLLRLHMYSADMLVSSTLQKQYKMLFLVDPFNSDLRTFLDKHKEAKTTISPKTLFSFFYQIAESIACAYDQKSTEKHFEISRVHLNNFVLNVAYSSDSIKFIHNPFLTIFDASFNASKYSAKNKISYRSTHSNSHTPSHTAATTTPSTASSTSMSNKQSATTQQSKSIYSQQTRPNPYSTHSNSSSSSSCISNSNANSISNLQQSKKESIQTLEQSMVKDMAELYVRIATQSTEDWTPKESLEDLQSAWISKMKKGIRQIQIKYSQSLGNLITSMISVDVSERPSLRKIQQQMQLLESELANSSVNNSIGSSGSISSSSSNSITSVQKSVKFQPTASLPTTPSNGVRSVHITNSNNPHDKNPLISFHPPNEQSIVLVDLIDPKHAYIEKIEIEENKSEQYSLLNSVNPEGCRSANILLSNDYEIYAFGGFKSLRTSKFTRYTTILETQAPMLGRVSRHSFGICTVVTDIYILGGCDGDATVGACEKYDTRTNTWKRLSPMNVPVHSAAVCVFNNSVIYKFGGIQADTHLSQIIEKYDIATDTWIVVKYAIQPAIQKQFEFIANSLAAQINEMQIILIGGRKGNKDPAAQPKQIVLFNIYTDSNSYSHNATTYEVTDFNTLGSLVETTPVYADQAAIINNELLFVQMRQKSNAARLLSFSSPGGIKVLRKDLIW